MRNIHLWLATAVLAALPAAGAIGADQPSTTDRGLNFHTGQINPGFDKKVPSASKPRPIPTPQQAQAAAMTPSSTQISVGASGMPSAPSTTGSAQGAAAPAGNAAPQSPPGPIGAIGATMPAKFSARNDTLDRVPIMARPLRLSEQDRKTIYQAVMADNAPLATDVSQLAPASELSSKQYFRDLHPLPKSVGNIAAVKSLAYVKMKDKVLLVEPATRIVVGEITS